MAKSTAVIALAVLGALAVSFVVISKISSKTDTEALKATYASWKKEFNVVYGGPEDLHRFKTFAKTHQEITAINAKKLSYTLGLNAFSAMTDAEFASTKLGLKSKTLRTSGNTTALPIANLKTTVDWIGKGAVQKVKNQGSCGSCWAFSAIGALEGLSALTGKGLQDFSEQELVDCSGSYGNEGCGGGWMHWAFQYTAAKGIATQAQYPYKAVDGTCKTVTGDKFKNKDHVEVPVNSAEQLKAALNKQPVSVALQASATVFRNYKTGVVTGTACGTVLNHGVLAVGYNTDAATPYYNVKNSWGATWGDQGFIKIGIEDGVGVCGIQSKASYPTA